MPRAPDYRPSGVEPTLLPETPVATGTARNLDTLNGRLDSYLASRLHTDALIARDEGLAAGRIAGEADPGARDPGDSIRARAFNQGATEIGVRQSEIGIRNFLDEQARLHPNDPGAIEAAGNQYRDGIVQNLPPDRAALVRSAFQLHLRPYVTQAARNQELVVAQGRVTTTDAAYDQTLASIGRNAAGAAAGDAAAERALLADVDSARTGIVQLGPRIAFTLDGVQYPADEGRAQALTVEQMHERTRRLHDVATVETTLAYFRNRPPDVPASTWIGDFERQQREAAIMRPELLQHVVSRMHAEANRDGAALRATVSGLLHEDMGAIAGRGVGAGPGGTFRASDEQIRAAFPGIEGEQHIEARRVAQQSWQYRQELQGSSPAQRDARERELSAAITQGPAAEALPPRPAPPAGAPVGIRQNNWGNLRPASLVGFRRFDTPEEGIAAMTAQLDRYRERGLNTVQDIVSTWAPRGDGNNDPQRYAAFVAQAMGVGAADRIDTSDPATMRRLVGAMARFENGPNTLPPDSEDVIARGVAQARGTGAPAGTVARTQALEIYRRERHAYETTINQHPSDASLGQPEVAQGFQRWTALAQAGDGAAPAALQAAMQQSIDWQRNAGVRPEAIAPLPSNIVQSIAGRFAGAATDRERLAVLQSVTAVPDADMRARVIAQLRNQGPPDNRIPDQIGLVLDIAEDPARRSQAEAVLGALRIPGRDATTWQPGDRAAVDSQINSTFDDSEGMGGVLQRQRAVTGNADYGRQREQYRDALAQVARARLAPGSGAAAVDGAQADMFGHLRALSETNFAHVYVPAATDMNALRAGLLAAREREAARFAERRPPESAGPQARRRFDAVARDLPTTATWVNEGRGLALVVPATGAAIARMSLAEIVALGREHPIPLEQPGYYGQ